MSVYWDKKYKVGKYAEAKEEAKETPATVDLTDTVVVSTSETSTEVQAAPTKAKAKKEKEK